MQDLINKITQGYGTKPSKRGVLVTTEDGTPLDCLLEIRGRQQGKGNGPAKKEAAVSQYVACVSKATKTIRVTDAAGVKAARTFLAAQAKAVAARKAAAKPKAVAPAKPKAQRKSGVKVTT